MLGLKTASRKSSGEVDGWQLIHEKRRAIMLTIAKAAKWVCRDSLYC